MTTIVVPSPIGEGLNFRWFTEYVIDNSPLFKTASAVAKAGMVLAADLDTVDGRPGIGDSAVKLIRDALSSDESPLPLPEVMASRTDESGANVGEPFSVPLRVYTRFISAWMTDAE